MTDMEDKVILSSHKTEDTKTYDIEDKTEADLRYQRLAELVNADKLQILSMDELYDQVFSDRPPIIDGLLYTGAYLLAGAPKVGKSFLAAQIAYHVSTGQKLWDYDVRQGTVLYLALEDNYQRLQARLSRMFGVEGTANLYALLAKIASFLTPDSPSWEGSATELAARLGEDIQPNILTRRLNVKHDVLKNDYGICYVSRHTRNGSMICLTREEQTT
ncbi:MAG: AAA family ATPase [Oscillospiraceae bacterium]|nr:AAA family ATPase [Oscillospiraceae bacterium]